jgi:hypothetical protein
LTDNPVGIGQSSVRRRWNLWRRSKVKSVVILFVVVVLAFAGCTDASVAAANISAHRSEVRR